MRINSRTAAKDLVKVLEETDSNVSISTVKRVVYRQNQIGHSARKKPMLQNHHKKPRSATEHGQKMCCLAIMTLLLFGGKRGRLASQKIPSQP